MFPVGTLGDTLGWFPYAVKFQQTHGCRLTCAMAERLIPLFADAYPDIRFVTHEDAGPEPLLRHLSAGPVLRRHGLHSPALRLPLRRAASHRRLHPGRRSDRGAAAARAARTTGGRSPNPMSASRCRAPRTQVLEQSGRLARGRRVPEAGGYRVDLHRPEAVHGTGIVWNHIPHGVEDETGDRPLAERARWLRHAAFFVGLSSGLSGWPGRPVRRW